MGTRSITPRRPPVPAGPCTSSTPARRPAVSSSVHFHNNIFDVKGTSQLVNAPRAALAGVGDMLFQGNDYFTGTAPMRIGRGNCTYGTLASWRTATAQEVFSGTTVGLNVDPKLVSPGAGGTPAPLTSMTAHKLQSGSPLLGAGLNMAALG